MRKTLVLFLVFVFSVVAFGAVAQDGTTTAAPVDTSTTVTPSASSGQTSQQGSGRVTPPFGGGPSPSSGSSSGNVGDEVSRLQKEMEQRIKAIRDEYKVKIDAARKAAQTSRQNARQNIKQNIKSNVGQKIKQSTGLDTRQNLKQNLQQGGLFNNFQQNGGSSINSNQQQFQPIQQVNPIGPTQEQFGPPPSGQGGGLPGPSGSSLPSSGSSSGGFSPSSGPSGGNAPAPFSSSILEKFLPNYSW